MPDILIIFLIACAIMSLLVIWLVRAGNKEMDKKAQQSGAISVFTALHFEGLGLPNKVSCDLYLYPDKVFIDTYNGKFEIPISRIKAAAYKSEQELREKSKSVVGRAFIGSLFAPGLGTIVGAVSGIGNKTVKGKTNFT